MYAYLGAYIVKYYMKYIHVGTYIGLLMNFISLLSDATVGPTRTEGTWQLEGCGRKTAVAGKEKKKKNKKLELEKKKKRGADEINANRDVTPEFFGIREILM